MAETLGAYSLETSKLVLATVRYLQAAGYIPRDGQRGRNQQPLEPPIFVRNDSEEEIPAWACMQCIGTVEADGMNYLKVDQPIDATGAAGVFVFNGPEPIEIDGYGLAFAGPVVRALGEGSTATAGATWTPTAGEWTIKPGGTLLTMLGDDDIDEDVVRVRIDTIEGIIHCKTPAGGIAGRAGLQMSFASCDLYDCSQSGLLSDSNTNLDVWNAMSSAVAELTHILAAKNTAGLWICISEDCP